MRIISEVAVILPKLRGESAKRRKELIFKKETATFGAKSNNWVVEKNCIYHVYNESITVYVDLLVYRESQTGRRWPALSNRGEKQYHYRYYPALYYTQGWPLSTTTGVVEQCLPGLRRFDPSPLLSEFQLGQKVDPCLLGLGPRHIIISLRPTQYTKYKSSTYKVQTREEKMVKSHKSQVANTSDFAAQ